MLRLVGEYLFFVFLASLGVLQGVAAWNRLGGLSFFRSRLFAYPFSLGALGLAYLWFFWGGKRNVPGLEGAQQSLLFPIGAFCALLVTAALASLRGGKPSTPNHIPPGIDALRSTTFGGLLRRKG